ncbi:hypothetical protein NX059_006650 [Plenodomus lindquistii]|nr:hypothetical protein NX059_006650 [Plenodomus lindquistii]
MPIPSRTGRLRLITADCRSTWTAAPGASGTSSRTSSRWASSGGWPWHKDPCADTTTTTDRFCPRFVPPPLPAASCPTIATVRLHRLHCVHEQLAQGQPVFHVCKPGPLSLSDGRHTHSNGVLTWQGKGSPLVQSMHVNLPCHLPARRGPGEQPQTIATTSSPKQVPSILSWAGPVPVRAKTRPLVDVGATDGYTRVKSHHTCSKAGCCCNAVYDYCSHQRESCPRRRFRLCSMHIHTMQHQESQIHMASREHNPDSIAWVHESDKTIIPTAVRL